MTDLLLAVFVGSLGIGIFTMTILRDLTAWREEERAISDKQQEMLEAMVDHVQATKALLEHQTLAANAITRRGQS